MSEQEHCPIPTGWTVSVCSVPQKRGVEVRAVHESGREAWAGIYNDPGEDKAIDAAMLWPIWRSVVLDMNKPLSDSGTPDETENAKIGDLFDSVDGQVVGKVEFEPSVAEFRGGDRVMRPREIAKSKTAPTDSIGAVGPEIRTYLAGRNLRCETKLFIEWVKHLNVKFTVRELTAHYTDLLSKGYRATRWHHPEHGVDELLPTGHWITGPARE